MERLQSWGPLGAGGVLLVFFLVLSFVASLPVSLALISGGFLLVGFLFGKATTMSRWITWLFLVSPVAIVSVLLVMNGPVLALIPLAALASAGVGLTIRAYWTPSRRPGLITALVGWTGILLVTAFFVLPSLLEASFTKTESTTFPPFRLETLDGVGFSSTTFAGKVVVLDFWATWCGPCIQAFPEYQRLHEKYRDNPEIAFYAVNTSWRNDTREMAQQFMRERGFTFPAVYDSLSRASTLLNIRSIPTTLVFDRKGVLRLRHTGSSAGTGRFFRTISETIEQLLSEP